MPADWSVLALASGLTPQEMRDLFFSLERTHFWDPGLGFGLLRGRKFLQIVQRHMAPSFAETKVPLELAAFDLSKRATVFLQEGPLAEAVVATCAVPLMFHPVRIGDSYFIDGGLFHKSGVNHDAVSARTLCIYLQSQSLGALYERRRAVPDIPLSARQKVLRFGGLPKVTPFKLSNGKIAFAEAYQRTREVLKQPIGKNQILDA